MLSDKLQVITLNPNRTLKRVELPIVYEDGTYCITYLGDNYKIYPEKVFLEGKKPTIILNPFMLDMVHELTPEQWREKIGTAC